MKIGSRLYATFLALSIICITLAVTGILSLKKVNRGLETVYNDRVVPLQELKVISDKYAVWIVDTAQKVHAQNMSYEKGSELIKNALRETKITWDTYTATSMTPEEQKLVNEMKPLFEKANETANRLLVLFALKDEVKLEEIVNTDLYPTIDPLTEHISMLTLLQLNVAKQEYMKGAEIYESSRLLYLTVTLVAILLNIAAVFMVRGRVIQPIFKMTAVMQALATGEHSIAIPFENNKDEIGTMAKTVAVFKKNMIENEELQKSQKEIEQKAATERRNARHKMADEFEKRIMSIVKNVSSSASFMQSTSKNMSIIAEETSIQATSVSAASTQASNNVETVAAATEELSASVHEISSRVSQSATIAQKATEESKKTTTTMAELAASSSKIGEVVALIHQIASQTNLLALNATIEAARAGEAGKGFAVVASEVKGLANQTAKATEEISAQIAAIQTETNNAVQAIGSISGIINQVSDISSSIASAVEEQGNATQEIARNVQQASQGTHMVSENIAAVTNAAARTGTSAKEVFSSADELAQNADLLRREVEGFLSNIRGG